VSTFSVQIDVPAELRKFGFTPETIQREVPTMLVLKRFKEGAISSGKAAELLSISRPEFLDLLGREGIAIYNPTTAELASEFRLAEELAVKAQ
jgi:predicted HTH domain antitoxin